MVETLPLISILTPAYNCARYIGECIDSVASQGYSSVEHIIVDGASQDGTVAVLEEYARKYPHLKWISEPDEGEADALNKALKMAQGDIIGWLNADDYYLPGALSIAAEYINAHENRHLVYGNTHFVDEQGGLVWEKISASEITLPLILRFWENGRLFHQPSIFYSRELIQQVGPFNSELHFSIDYEQWLRCIVKCRPHYVDAVLSCARIRPAAKSAESPKLQNKNHWKVGLPYHRYLSLAQRLGLWRDYFLLYHLPIIKAAIRARLNPRRYLARGA